MLPPSIKISLESRCCIKREITSSSAGPEGTRIKTFLGLEIELINLLISSKTKDESNSG